MNGKRKRREFGTFEARAETGHANVPVATIGDELVNMKPGCISKEST
jgi:hypothetical protein